MRGKSPEMGDTAHQFTQIETCLAQLGQDGFLTPFLEMVEATGAAQIMVFSYTLDHAACLLSRNFRAGALGARLAAEYLDGWYREDPLFADVLALEGGQSRPGDPGDRMSADYRARFFEAPDLSGKSATLIAGERLRLAVNLYWAGDAARQPDLCALLARLALLHFEARPEHAYPAALDVLSDRERAVCLGMLAGKKAELIAAELGLAPSSIITYRKRAYAKLGINSRGSLFALCRP